MRRSRSIRLTLLAASAIALQACGSEDVDAADVVVPDLAACLERFGVAAQADCQRSFAEGQTRHIQTAPRFASVEACREATGGACEVTPARAADKALVAPGLASVAIPVMAGLMIGRMLENGSGRVTVPLYSGRPPSPLTAYFVGRQLFQHERFADALATLDAYALAPGTFPRSPPLAQRARLSQDRRGQGGAGRTARRGHRRRGKCARRAATRRSAVALRPSQRGHGGPAIPEK
jgi:uncharacterized protein YgiB involved in biofilm formation